MDELVSVIQQLAIEVLLDEIQHLLQQRVERHLVRSDRGDRQLGSFQEILRSDLGSGNLELVSEATLQTPDDHPLFLQAAAAGQVKVEDGVGENQVCFRAGTDSEPPD